MKIRHLRNACMIFHSGSNRILVDPCLGPKGSLPPYVFFRCRPRLNPLVDLPVGSESWLHQITGTIITHCRYGHFDHLDNYGIRLLAQRQVPVYCNHLDAPFLKRNHIRTIPLQMNQKQDFLEGSIVPFPTAHGYGLTRKLMGPGAGYFIELPGEPSIYISGDTILNETVLHVLATHKPDISILNAGTAALDIGRPILMPMDELLDFMKIASGRVIAVHLDAFNHCRTTRMMLKETVLQEGLSGKVLIPEDGELMDL